MPEQPSACAVSIIPAASGRNSLRELPSPIWSSLGRSPGRAWGSVLGQLGWVLLPHSQPVPLSTLMVAQSWPWLSCPSSWGLPQTSHTASFPGSDMGCRASWARLSQECRAPGRLFWGVCQPPPGALGCAERIFTSEPVWELISFPPSSVMAASERSSCLFSKHPVPVAEF